MYNYKMDGLERISWAYLVKLFKWLILETVHTSQGKEMKGYNESASLQSGQSLTGKRRCSYFPDYACTNRGTQFILISFL
jgi:hypothetical protein